MNVSNRSGKTIVNFFDSYKKNNIAYDIKNNTPRLMLEGSKFFPRLKSRVDSLQRKYANNEIKASLKLFWWSCREVFCALFYSCFYSISKRLAKRSDGKLKIAIIVSGGIGDIYYPE
ncbi:MAG: hypothetical protein LBD34_03485 [Puniceicoccales bacterium]|jgi:hypothetical protein|nr:hypothetical protein [Puniceicoccales bacterium]